MMSWILSVQRTILCEEHTHCLRVRAGLAKDEIFSWHPTSSGRFFRILSWKNSTCVPCHLDVCFSSSADPQDMFSKNNKKKKKKMTHRWWEKRLNLKEHSMRYLWLALNPLSTAPDMGTKHLELYQDNLRNCNKKSMPNKLKSS